MFFKMKPPILLALMAFLLLNSCKKSQSPDSKNHFIGELYGGGIIVELHQDAQGEEHGLIVSLSDVAVKSVWSAQGAGGAIITNANSISDGKANCQNIKLTLGFSGTACNLCLDFKDGNNIDWYLPSISELFNLYDQIDIINPLLEIDKDITTMPISPERYWTSTEFDGGSSAAYTVNMLNGKIELFSKSNDMLRVRAVRNF